MGTFVNTEAGRALDDKTAFPSPPSDASPPDSILKALRLFIGYRFALLTITLLGLVLRFVAAQGDLGFDEIQSLNHLGQVRRVGGVFVGIAHDNNHVLTSLWLYLIGPDASFLLMRLQAIIAGTLCIPMAARLGRRYGGDATGLAAALLMAMSYFFVAYGSEARGYAGMTLAVLLAYDQMELILLYPDRRRHYLGFALAICLGTFSHLTMVEAAFALCLTATARLWTERRSNRDRLRLQIAVPIAAALGVAPAIGCFLADYLSGSYRVGFVLPFTLSEITAGVVSMVRGVVGESLFFTIPILYLGFAHGVVPPARRWFPAIALILLPLLHSLAQLNNQHFPRFFLTGAIALILLLADLLAGLLRKGWVAKWVAIAGFCVILGGQALDLRHFFTYHRGNYEEALRLMALDGPIAYAVDAQGTILDGEAQETVNYFASRLGIAANHVELDDWCRHPPLWLISPGATLENPQERLESGPASCVSSFRRKSAFPKWGLAGTSWTLYRRDTN